jgi:hypothetical protein
MQNLSKEQQDAYEMAAAQHLKMSCRFCGTQFADTSEIVYAGCGTFAHDLCFKQQPPEVLEAAKQADILHRKG